VGPRKTARFEKITVRGTTMFGNNVQINAPRSILSNTDPASIVTEASALQH
jgi:hypothetical protein